MQTNKPTAAHILFTRTDAEIIHLAGELLGTQKLRLTIAEAVAVIRAKY